MGSTSLAPLQGDHGDLPPPPWLPPGLPPLRQPGRQPRTGCKAGGGELQWLEPRAYITMNVLSSFHIYERTHRLPPGCHRKVRDLSIPHRSQSNPHHPPTPPLFIEGYLLNSRRGSFEHYAQTSGDPCRKFTVVNSAQHV